MTRTAKRILRFIVRQMVSGIFCKAQMVLRRPNSALTKTNLFRQILTATAKPTLPFIARQMAFGIF